MKILEQTAAALAASIRAGDVRSEEVVEAYLDRIRKQDKTYHAYLKVTDETALKQAAEVDAARKSGKPLGPLAGVPISLKDNLCTRGVETTCASNILKGFKPPYDATVVRRVAAAGMPSLGKTNLDEFAMGSSTENSGFGPTRNPFDPERVPGGSSGGSACSVGGRLAPLSLGSDTGGSIRQPAAFCSCVGLKPTYGRVSRYGLIAFASSLDQIGPFARTALDAALLMSVIAGPDSRDATCLAEPAPDYAGGLGAAFKPATVGLPKEYFAEGLAPDVRAALDTLIKDLQSLGCTFKEVSLPHTRYAVPTYYILAPAEASSNLARFDGIRYGPRAEADNLLDVYLNTRDAGFGREVKRRIMLGTYALSSGYYDAYYNQALKVRRLIYQDFETVFREVDVLLTPTTPTVPFKFGEKASDPLQMYLSDIYTISANLAGIPALSFPCGAAGGLPVGAQLMGPALRESALLRIVHEYEKLGRAPAWKGSAA